MFGGLVGPPELASTTDRLRVLLHIGEEERRQRDLAKKRETIVPTSGHGDGAGSSSSTHDGRPQPKRMPRSLGGAIRATKRCIPVPRDRFVASLRRFYELQRNIPRDLHPRLAAPLGPQTTLRIILGPQHDRPPQLAGSMWELIRPRDPFGTETPEEEAARADPRFRDFFRMAMGLVLNAAVYRPVDWKDFEWYEQADEHGNISAQKARKLRRIYARRIRFEENDNASNDNLRSVLAGAVKELYEPVGWEMAFQWAREEFGKDPNGTPFFPPPIVDVSKLHESPRCPDVLIVDITVQKADVQSLMDNDDTRRRLYRSAEKEAEPPPFPVQENYAYEESESE